MTSSSSTIGSPSFLFNFESLAGSARSVTFAPGPSQLSPETLDDLREAALLRIPEINHRSAAFTSISASAQRELRDFFRIPEDYRVFYASSATEAMELLVRNCVSQASFHFTFGSFSELFAEVSRSYGNDASCQAAPWGDICGFAGARIPAQTELVSITACETSTGVCVSNGQIRLVREEHPDPLLCVDITSLAGMRDIRIADADAWFFSVQKGLGLPPGLALLIVSPRLLRRAERLRKAGKTAPGLFSFARMSAFAEEHHQTIMTPNSLAIFLLGRQLRRWNQRGGIEPIAKACAEKSRMLYAAVDRHPRLRAFPIHPSTRAPSVVCASGTPETIAALHAQAAQAGMLLGQGYGPLRETAVRFATFPAVTFDHIKALTGVLSSIH